MHTATTATTTTNINQTNRFTKQRHSRGVLSGIGFLLPVGSTLVADVFRRNYTSRGFNFL